jgi:hypothetical protein
MKKPARKTFPSAVGIIVAVMLIAGCQEQNLSDETPSEKMSRLIAAENIDLKKQIEEQNVAHAKEMQKQQNVLDGCLADKKALEKRTKKEIERQVNEVVSVVIAKNGELRQENQELKTQNNRLALENQNLKAQIETLKMQAAADEKR